MKKTEVIHKELGSLTPVVARRIDQALARGIEHDRAEDVATTIDHADRDGGDTGARVRTRKVEMGHEENEALRLSQNPYRPAAWTSPRMAVSPTLEYPKPLRVEDRQIHNGQAAMPGSSWRRGSTGR